MSMGAFLHPNVVWADNSTVKSEGQVANVHFISESQLVVESLKARVKDLYAHTDALTVGIHVSQYVK